MILNHRYPNENAAALKVCYELERLSACLPISLSNLEDVPTTPSNPQPNFLPSGPHVML